MTPAALVYSYQDSGGGPPPPPPEGEGSWAEGSRGALRRQAGVGKTAPQKGKGLGKVARMGRTQPRVFAGEDMN